MHMFYIWQLTRKCLIILTHRLTFWTKANLKYCNDMSIQTLCCPAAGTGTGTGTLLRGRGQAERDRWKPDPDSPGHLRLSHTFTNSRINQKAHRSVLGTPLETSWCGPVRDLWWDLQMSTDGRHSIGLLREYLILISAKAATYQQFQAASFFHSRPDTTWPVLSAKTNYEDAQQTLLNLASSERPPHQERVETLHGESAVLRSFCTRWTPVLWLLCDRRHKETEQRLILDNYI